MSRELQQGCNLELGSRSFTIKELVGRGASCIVYRAECTDNTEHLLKEYNPRYIAMYREGYELCLDSEDDRDEFEAGLVRFREGHIKQRELRLDNDLKNSTCNIQGVYAANGTEYIDMTCYTGDSYEKVEERLVCDLMRRMKALAQVIGNYHKAGLLHLDIKPENIFTLPETCELVMLFDFDSVVSKESVATGGARSYTLSWAAPEQLSPLKRNMICEATDIFALGEIIFYKLMGRHSTIEERLSFAEYHFDHKLPIFENLNPKVFPMLEDLLHHTICVSIKERYQSTDELVAKLDEIIKLANPEAPLLAKKIPYVQEHFVGRTREIQRIHELLLEKGTVFVSGVGGIGKSELVKKYAEEYQAYYDTITFVPFETDIVTTVQQAENLPYNVKQHSNEKPEEYFVHKVEKLQKLCDARTLIVIDNFDVTDDPNIKFLFSLGCKMLVTTRADFSDVYTQLMVDAVENPLEIFKEHYKKTLTEEDQCCTEKILEIICGHTLTTELLAKQMVAGRIEPDQMLGRIQSAGIGNTGKDKIRHIDKNGSVIVQSAYDHIQALFDLSQLDAEEQYILANLASIPYTGIPTKLFHDWCELDDYDLINRLIAEGWIQQDKDKDYISLHPVVSEIIEERMHVIQIKTLLKNFSAYISNESDDYDVHVFGQQTKYLVYSLAYRFARYLIKLDEEFDYIIDTLYKIGGVLYDFSDYENCEKVWVKVFTGYQSQGDIKDIAEIQCSLALLYADMGRLTQDKKMILKAIESYQSAIQTFTELEDWASLATIYNNIGSAYHDLKEYAAAVSMYRYSIECHERQAEKGSRYISSVAICHNNIGVLYKDMQLYCEAIESYRHALTLLETQPRNSVDNALVRHNLAVVLFKQDNPMYNLHDAKECAEEALEIRKYLFFADNIWVAQTEELLARILLAFNLYDYDIRAEALLTAAKQPYIQHYGKDHSETIRMRNALEESRGRIKKRR